MPGSRTCHFALAGTALLALAACSGPGPGGRPHTPTAGPASTATATRTLPAGPAAALPSLQGAAFPTRATGWLLATARPGTASARAQIWHTATAGATWQVQWRGRGNATSITAPSSDHAWALISCPGPDGQRACRRELAATSDGGRHWRRVARLAKTVTAVQFISARFGFATADTGCAPEGSPSRCHGQVLVSHDGGRRWVTVLRSAHPVFATASAAGQLWVAEAILGAAGPMASPVTFLTSTDGGLGWQPLGQLTGLGPLTASTQVQLAAGPAGLAWASVFDTGSCAMHGCSTAQLYGSGDGGRSWAPATMGTRSSVPCGRSSITFAAAPDGTAWAATGQNAGACPPPYAFLFRHTGARWLTLPPWQLTGVSSIAPVSRRVAYAIGAANGQGIFARTDDGGKSWTQLLPVLAPAAQVDALTPATAVGAQDATDAGAILRSGDGGLTWRQVARLPGIVTWVDFPVTGTTTTPSHGIAVTFRSVPRPAWWLWRSHDGGLTWTRAGRLMPHVTSGNVSVDGPWMTASGSGLLLTVAQSLAGQPSAGGAAPVRAWTTTDWGAHWARGRLLPVGRDVLEAASFVPAGPGRWAGWLVHLGAKSDLIESSGGTARALTPVAHSPSVNAVQLVAPGAGFAWRLGWNTRAKVPFLLIYRTADGGRHWQRSKLTFRPTPSPPLLTFTGPADGWLLVAGLTWHTSDGGLTWHRA
jgi:photosystem II stability/assembly factor-like uncharacterized protein